MIAGDGVVLMATGLHAAVVALCAFPPRGHCVLLGTIEQIETETAFQAEQIWEKQLQKLSTK